MLAVVAMCGLVKFSADKSSNNSQRLIVVVAMGGLVEFLAEILPNNPQCVIVVVAIVVLVDVVAATSSIKVIEASRCSPSDAETVPPRFKSAVGVLDNVDGAMKIPAYVKPS